MFKEQLDITQNLKYFSNDLMMFIEGLGENHNVIHIYDYFSFIN